MQHITTTLDPSEQLRENLTKFLCLKYEFSNIELQTQIEDKTWKEKLSDWTAIKQLLTLKPTPMNEIDFYKSSTEKPIITVILPKDPAKCFEYLKAAAYFPWQLDPKGDYDNFAYDESIMIQLAFATKYGMFRARSLIRSTTHEMFPKLPQNHRWCEIGSQSINYSDSYYEFAVPDTYCKNKPIENPIPFNPKTGAQKTLAFFDYLLEIAKKNGTRPSEVTYR